MTVHQMLGNRSAVVYTLPVNATIITVGNDTMTTTLLPDLHEDQQNTFIRVV